MERNTSVMLFEEKLRLGKERRTLLFLLPFKYCTAEFEPMLKILEDEIVELIIFFFFFYE